LWNKKINLVTAKSNTKFSNQQVEQNGNQGNYARVESTERKNRA